MSRPRIEDNEVPVSASDGDVPTVDSGVLVYAPPPVVPLAAGDLTTRYQPTVMVTGGVPELVYDSNDNLMMVEVPNP